MNQNATYYCFIDERDEDDIDIFGDLYKSALLYINDSSSENALILSQYFDLAINKKGNGTSKITMGLYWIAPTHFLNLDRRNTWYIYVSGKMPLDLVNNIMAIGWDTIGDLNDYNSKGEMKQKLKECYDPSGFYINSACATWEFANEMKPGDIVFAKNGMHLIIGRGVVKSDYIYDPQRKENSS